MDERLSPRAERMLRRSIQNGESLNLADAEWLFQEIDALRDSLRAERERDLTARAERLSDEQIKRIAIDYDRWRIRDDEGETGLAWRTWARKCGFAIPLLLDEIVALRAERDAHAVARREGFRKWTEVIVERDRARDVAAALEAELASVQP